jgi:hypothetical protein
LEECEDEIEKMESVGDVPNGWIRRMPEALFYTIVGYEDQLHIGKCMTEREIADAVRLQSWREGDPLPEECSVQSDFEAALKRMSEKGRVLELFDTDTQWRAFLVRAETLGLEKEATRLVQSVRGRAMNNAQIRALALQCGFQLKDQGDGTMDLNPYVYEFADRLIRAALERLPTAVKPTVTDWSPNMETCTLELHGEKHHYRKECNNLRWGEEHD